MQQYDNSGLPVNVVASMVVVFGVLLIFMPAANVQNVFLNKLKYVLRCRCHVIDVIFRRDLQVYLAC